MSAHLRCALFTAALLALAGVPRVSAEIVFFTSGRTMSVQSHRMDGDALVLTLRDGGEITCDRSMVARIGPDEVPYPVPAASTTPAPVPSAAALAVSGAPAPYDAIVRQVASRQGVDPRLVRAVIAVESGWEPGATSPKGAMGLMQLMPATAREYNVGDPYDPRANIEAGVRRLKQLLDHFSLQLALAAYNAGEAAVDRFGGVPPYPETQAYIARVLARVGP
jgi:soluble lytic murein transglycosylase-like protein